MGTNKQPGQLTVIKILFLVDAAFQMKGFFMFKYKHGFCIIRCQPFHIGHNRLIEKMMAECEHGTVLIGSAQESGTEKNPLAYFVRKKMVQNVWRHNEAYNRLRIIGVKDDISIPWNYNVLETIRKEQSEICTPDVMYVGTQKEYLFFAHDVPHVEICSRTTQNFPFLSGNMVRDMIVLEDERWKNFVHPENYDLVKKYFYEDNIN